MSRISEQRTWWWRM
jgi:RNA polymerase I-specific transcription initiation factor RRN7